jgi:hypothetical protein
MQKLVIDFGPRSNKGATPENMIIWNDYTTILIWNIDD